MLHVTAIKQLLMFSINAKQIQGHMARRPYGNIFTLIRKLPICFFFMTFYFSLPSILLQTLTKFHGDIAVTIIVSYCLKTIEKKD